VLRGLVFTLESVVSGIYSLMVVGEVQQIQTPSDVATNVNQLV